MSWSTKRVPGSLAITSFVFVMTGCAQHHLCSSAEVCNYADDDCDGRLDEGFVDADGVYRSPEHCGGCGVRCADTHPTAAATECVISPEGVVEGCRIVACPPEEHLGGDGACVPDAPVSCLPCLDDADCALRQPGSRCLPAFANGRCLEFCEVGCAPGFECAELSGEPLCFPMGGDCSCNAENRGATIACTITSPDGSVCAGQQECTDAGYTSCASALEERCNGVDEDCDGQYDEGFLLDGVYVHPLHCGECGLPCSAPGPNMTATCSVSGGAATCGIACDEGFVDVDGIPANGCECERRVSDGAPIGVGTDGDCDGVIDDSDEFIFVTSTGNDRDPGTLARPMRSLGAAMRRASSLGRDVLVARGVYVGAVDMVSGVSAFGGYRPDFRERDLETFPVVLERREVGPVLTCHQVRGATRFEGFEIYGFDGEGAGAGSTALYLDRCSDAVVLRDIQVFAGRGGSGLRGRSAVDRLIADGLSSLAELDGRDGRSGGGGHQVVHVDVCPAGARGG